MKPGRAAFQPWENACMATVVLSTLALKGVLEKLRPDADLRFDATQAILRRLSEGERADHVVSFARGNGGRAAVTVVGRFYSLLLGDSGGDYPGQTAWSDTTIPWPKDGPGVLTDLFTGSVVSRPSDGDRLQVGELLHHLPVAVLIG